MRLRPEKFTEWTTHIFDAKKSKVNKTGSPSPWQEVFVQSLKYNRKAAKLRKNKTGKIISWQRAFAMKLF